MKTYLDDILKAKHSEVSSMPRAGFEQLQRARVPRDFIGALQGPSISIIAEIKPKSPSCGSFNHTGNAIALALRYQNAGAAAISVLADRKFFGGSPDLVEQVANDPRLHLPILYKDFILDRSQIYEARSRGADAVLLISRAIDRELLRDFVVLTHELNMHPIVEVFDQDDIASALSAGTRILGINNRDLRTFAVDLQRSIRLAEMIPDGIVKVSESGISCRSDVLRLDRAGFDAMLVGEALLASPDPGDKLVELLGNEE